MSSSRPPIGGPSHSRSASLRSQTGQQHAPITPSGLREAQTISSSPDSPRMDPADGSSDESVSPDQTPVHSHSHGDPPRIHLDSTASAYGTIGANAQHDEGEPADESTALLGESARSPALLRLPYDFAAEHVHPGPCNHGTFSPKPGSRAGSIRSVRMGYFGSAGILSRGDSNGKKLSTTERLAQEHGIETSKLMYVLYYIPFFAWIKQYKWSYLRGDFVAALTMASFYIPMALSYAENLGHVPPINGLYSFVFNPIIYALLGTCPQMVVGPEAAGSLLLGSVVRGSVDKGIADDDDGKLHSQIAGLVTGMAGAVILAAGIARLGFLESVLSRPFMRGFISSVGFIIVIDQLLTEMGLSKLAEKAGVDHGSSVEKIRFIISHAKYAHGLTCAVAAVSFVTIMVLRELKRRLQPRYPAVSYVPDRFLVVVLGTVLTYLFAWDQKGLKILGDVKSASGGAFPFHWPFQTGHMTHIREAMGTSFLIAMLGFFESSVAAKALGGGEGKGGETLQGIQLSANRELVALGVANVIGGCFMALPAFGGYGRSKVNASTGGKTPMSSVFLSIITVICVLYLMPYFYYLPKAVLSALITVVAWSLIEECPHDILFFMHIRGYTELGLMLIIFAATVFYSLNLGIAIGVGLSLLSVIKHSTRPRIQILGRIPGTNRFENAEDNPDKLEFVEGCLIVKIPEPLTFANTGDLKNRLRRLELYGTTAAHPALPRVRAPEKNKNIIFDIHGVTGLDGSGTQVLQEIVHNYHERRVRVYFTRGPSEGSPIWELFERSGIVEACGESHFVDDVGEALRLMELEEMGEEAEYTNLAGDEGGG